MGCPLNCTLAGAAPRGVMQSTGKPMLCVVRPPMSTATMHRLPRAGICAWTGVSRAMLRHGGRTFDSMRVGHSLLATGSARSLRTPIALGRVSSVVVRSVGSEDVRTLEECQKVELRGALAPDVAGVYAVLDEEGMLQYIGLSLSLSSSFTDHAYHIPEQESRWVKFIVMTGCSKPELQVAWKGWIKSHGAIPPGNQKADTRWTQRAPPQKAEPPAPALRSADAHRWDAANALVSQEVLRELQDSGFVVLDDVLDANQIEAVKADLRGLQALGKMQYVDGGSQIKLGRQDMVCVLDESNQGQQLLVGTGRPDGKGGEEIVELQGAPEVGGALAQVAALLKGLPFAVMEQAESLGGVDGLSWLLRLAVPHSLMLAVYPGEGAKYVEHLDNDEEDPRTREGPPGQRICDRAITAIIYFNTDWREDRDGGCLRVQNPDGSGHVDIAPAAGRLVLFQSKLVWHEVLPAFRRRWALSAWIPQQLT